MKQSQVTPGPGYAQGASCPYMPWEIGYGVYKRRGIGFCRAAAADRELAERARVPGPSYVPARPAGGRSISPRLAYRGEPCYYGE